MIETQKYVRKPLFVDAVRITSANFEEIATWCQGEILTDDAPQGQTARDYIKVRVHNPKNPRQTKAFVGDWLLYTERGYKVYTHKPFCASFDEAAGVIEPQDLLTRDQARECVKLPVDDSPAHAAAVEDVKARATAEDLEDGTEPVNPGAKERIEQDQVIAEAETEVEKKRREDNSEVLARALDDPSAEAEDTYVRELVDAAAEQQAEKTEKEWQSSEMAKAQALIESEGGSVEETTPEGIASAVQANEETLLMNEAEGKRVLSLEEQEQMDQTEVKELIQSGEAVLIQDLTVQQ